MMSSEEEGQMNKPDSNDEKTTSETVSSGIYVSGPFVGDTGSGTAFNCPKCQQNIVEFDNESHKCIDVESTS